MIDCTVEDFESGNGEWTADPASTCSTGSFVAGTPNEIISSGVTTQLAGDHTTGTGNAFYTQPNSGAGTDDVDGGECIAMSPSYSVAQDSWLSIWYFHGQRDTGNDPSGDYFALELSTDGGNTWGMTLASNGDITMNAVWTEATTLITAGSNVKIRARVSDGSSNGDLIEAGVDDLPICPIHSGCSADIDCDDGSFCSGTETCNLSTNTCEEGTNPCQPGEVCDEANDRCVDCLFDTDCDDGSFCNGAEMCNLGTNTCDAGTDPCPGQDCDEANDRCVDCLENSQCDDGSFCNGAEMCDLGTNTCATGPDPCPGQVCDEVSDNCVGCLVNTDCDDGLFCNGAETCDLGTNTCVTGPDPCQAGETCDENMDTCVSGAKVETMLKIAVGGVWEDVPLSGFIVPVPVCTAYYSGTPSPAVVRMQNVSPTGFKIKLQNPGDLNTVSPLDVHCLVVEKGS